MTAFLKICLVALLTSQAYASAGYDHNSEDDVTVTPTSQAAKSGSSVRFSCILPQRSHNLTVRWVHFLEDAPANGSRIFSSAHNRHISDSRFKVMRTPGGYDLVIKKVTAQFGGTYSCAIGGTYTNAILIVLDPVKCYTRPLVVLAGEQTQLRCSVVFYGQYRPQLAWTGPTGHLEHTFLSPDSPDSHVMQSTVDLVGQDQYNEATFKCSLQFMPDEDGNTITYTDECATSLYIKNTADNREYMFKENYAVSIFVNVSSPFNSNFLLGAGVTCLSLILMIYILTRRRRQLKYYPRYRHTKPSILVNST